MHAGAHPAHQQGAGHPLAGDVAEGQRDLAVGEGEGVVIVAADRLCGVVAGEETVSLVLGEFVRQQGFLHPLGDLHLAVLLPLLQRGDQQPVTLVAHRGLPGDGLQQVEIACLKLRDRVLGVEMDHPGHVAVERQHRDAHHRPDRQAGDAFAGVEGAVAAGVGGEVAGLLFHDLPQDRAAHLNGGVVPRLPLLLSRGIEPGAQIALFAKEDDAAIGAREDVEQGVEDLGEQALDVVRSGGGGEVTGDADDRFELLLGPHVQQPVPAAGRGAAGHRRPLRPLVGEGEVKGGFQVRSRPRRGGFIFKPSEHRAELQPIAGFQFQRRGDPFAVEEGAVAAVKVFHIPPAPVWLGKQPGVPAGDHVAVDLHVDLRMPTDDRFGVAKFAGVGGLPLQKNEFGHRRGGGGAKGPRRDPHDTARRTAKHPVPDRPGMNRRGGHPPKCRSEFPRNTFNPNSTVRSSLHPRPSQNSLASSFARMRRYMANFGRTNSSL